jgi:beta-barrel assembly-enhancing protease
MSSSPLTFGARTAALFFCAATVCSIGRLFAQASSKSEKVAGYAEFLKGDTLVVDGQRIVAGSHMTLKASKITSLTAIPLGYEVKVKGHREPGGAVIADAVEARPNGVDGKEKEILAASDEAEKTWVDKKMMFEPGDSGKIVKIGDILDSGPYVERARKIMDRLRPSYVPASALRVHVVKTDQWNASAMANGSVWVFTGIMDAMDDDEMAIVLGHELTHYTHEHVRRNMSKGGFGQILGVGSQIAAAQIHSKTLQTAAALGGQLGLSALMSGYSREFEDQADRVGLRYTYEAGFDMTKGPELWKKFKEKYGEEDKITNFFTGDHSRPTERIKNIQRQLKWNYPAGAQRVSTQNQPTH